MYDTENLLKRRRIKPFYVYKKSQHKVSPVNITLLVDEFTFSVLDESKLKVQMSNGQNTRNRSMDWLKGYGREISSYY